MTYDPDRLFEEFRKMVLDPDGDPPPSDDDVLKETLRKQADEDRFGPDDPRSDEELWAEAMRDEHFRAALRGEGSE